MIDWPAVFESRRKQLLERADSGFGHGMVAWTQARAAYMWAVSSANTDAGLTIAASQNLALCARALLDFADPLGGDSFLATQLSWSDANLKQAKGWAGTSADTLAAAIAQSTADLVPLKPSLIS